MKFKIKKSLSEQIAEYISDKIIRMEIKPGERVMEANIANKLGVSRSPIREALLILEKKRLVKLIPRRGARVTEMSGQFIEELCDVLSALLGLTGIRCVENGTREDLEKIDNTVKASRDFVGKGDVYGYYKSVSDFALACLKATKNQYLEQMVLGMMPSIRRVLYASFSNMGDELKKNLELIMTGNQYLQERNSEMAEKTVREYIKNEKEFILKNAFLAAK